MTANRSASQSCSSIGHIPSTCSVIAVTDETGPMGRGDRRWDEEIKLETWSFSSPVQQRHRKIPGGEQSCKHG